MGLFSFFSKKNKPTEPIEKPVVVAVQKQELKPVSYDDQLQVFESLRHKHDPEVTKEMILRDVYEMSWEDATEQYIESNPFSVLYYTFGWRNPQIKNYNYSEKCIWFDLEFFDANVQYKWFMERMGAITNGEITFTDISLETDSDNWEWINFNVNGIPKKWKLERVGYIADHFVHRFSKLPSELSTSRRFTYFDNGGQQWVIGYASEAEQIRFNEKTDLNREWLEESNHFSEPPTNNK